jgi:hypothetical protein
VAPKSRVAVAVPAHCYVYYRVTGDARAARAAVAAMMADLEARTGVAGRLLVRADDPSTWMEVYEPVPHPAAFGRALAACVRRHGVAAFACDGQRHVERFRAWPGPRRAPAR